MRDVIAYQFLNFNGAANILHINTQVLVIDDGHCEAKIPII